MLPRFIYNGEMMSSFDETVFRFLRRMYDEAGGKPGVWVDAFDAAEKVGISLQPMEYTPYFRYLKDSGWITTAGIYGDNACMITPDGIRVAEQDRPDTERYSST